MLFLHTPLIPSTPLGSLTGKKISLKLENLQPSGSFKMRGISAMCEHMVARGQKHVVSSSGGNAGYTAAWAARILGVPATIFVPESTREHLIRMMQNTGASVEKAGRFWEEAHHAAVSFAQRNGFEVLHPFDHPVIWEGHASMADEIAEQVEKPDAIVLSVGGGGLLAGLSLGLDRNGWSDVALVTVETKGADSLAQAVAAGKPVRLKEITSSVKTLGANQICDEAFRVTQTHRVLPVVISDEEAIRPCRQFMDDHRMLVEPACGAALSVAYNNHPVLKEFSTVLIIVCGGVSFTADDL